MDGFARPESGLAAVDEAGEASAVLRYTACFVRFDMLSSQSSVACSDVASMVLSICVVRFRLVELAWASVLAAGPVPSAACQALEHK